MCGAATASTSRSPSISPTPELRRHPVSIAARLIVVVSDLCIDAGASPSRKLLALQLIDDVRALEAERDRLLRLVESLPLAGDQP